MIIMWSNNESGDTRMESATALDRLVSYLQKYIINKDDVLVKRKKNEVLRKNVNSNRKTIYRLITPKSLNLNYPEDTCKKNVQTSIAKTKPVDVSKRKQIISNAKAAKQTIRCIPAKDMLYKPTESKKQSFADSERDCYKTRSGQISSLCSKPANADNINHTDNSNNLSENKPSNATARTVNSKYVCPTCNKIFLGRRLQRHYAQHPDHIKLPDVTTDKNNDSSLFGFLIAKLQNSNLNEDQRAELFLNEINDFVYQLHLCSAQLIRNTSGLHLVTANISRLLGIPEGQYTLDMSAISNTSALDATGFNENFDNINASSNSRNLDYSALSVSLDHTLTDEAAQKLNLSAGGKLLPPSEESLLRAVNDFVQDDIKPIVIPEILNPSPATMMPHYDHVSDNAVEAVSIKETHKDSRIIDLGVDFFQFNK